MSRTGLLRVGKIPYANLYPVFHALETRIDMRGVRFLEGSPAFLNRRLRAGRVDVSPSSSIEYALHPDLYALCPGVSVSAWKRVMSVLLLSREPLSRLPPDPIAVTTNSDTSVVLLEILLREFLGRENRLARTAESPAKALTRFPAVLSIGDEAIRASLAGTAPYATDLAALWRRHTGTPFVFALWIVSRASLARRGPAIRAFARALVAAKPFARDSVRGRSGPVADALSWMPGPYRAAYYRNLSWDLDGEIAGLRLFYRLARKIGRIPAVPVLKFLDPA